MAESLLSVVDLNPSVAIFPLKLVQGSTAQDVAEYLHARIETLVGIESKSGDPRKRVEEVQSLSPQTIDGWVYIGAIYRLEASPSWLECKPPPNPLDLNDDDIQDDGSDDDPRDLFRQQIWHLAPLGPAVGSCAAGSRFAVPR